MTQDKFLSEDLSSLIRAHVMDFLGELNKVILVKVRGPNME